jgi:GntR family transcriptional regulator
MTPKPGVLELDICGIDRTSMVPLYIQLKQILADQISSGVWPPATRLPGEPTLCREFGISRTVVRQALKEMSYEGLLLREKGRGTFVAEPKITSRSLVHSLSGFYEDMQERGSPPADQILERELIPAGSRIGSYLGVNELEVVHKITRLRFVRGEPIVLVTSYLPYNLCRELAQADLTHESLYAFLQERCGLRIERGLRRVEAVVADALQASLMKVPRGLPMLRIESISYLDDGRAIEYFHAFFRSDRTAFEVELLRVPEEARTSQIPRERAWFP